MMGSLTTVNAEIRGAGRNVWRTEERGLETYDGLALVIRVGRAAGRGRGVHGGGAGAG